MPKALKTRNLWTLCGLGAVLLWSFTGVIAGHAVHLPLFQFLAISQGMAFVAVALWITLRGRWKIVIKQPLWFWMTLLIVIPLNQLFYVGAFRSAPAAQCDMINYQWPMILALITALLPRHRFHWLYAVGAGLGMLGVVALCASGGEHFHFRGQQLIGSLYALGAVVTWIVYCLTSHFNPKAPAEMVGLVSLFSVGVYSFLHWTSGDSAVAMNATDWILAAGWGLGCFAAGYMLWDLGVRRGKMQVVAALSYLTPVGSIALLVCFGLAAATWSLAMATGLLLLGSLITGYGPSILGAFKRSQPIAEDSEETKLAA